MEESQSQDDLYECRRYKIEYWREHKLDSYDGKSQNAKLCQRTKILKFVEGIE